MAVGCPDSDRSVNTIVVEYIWKFERSQIEYKF